MLDRVCKILKMKPPNPTSVGLLTASGATVPTDGAAGYQPGAIFQHTDGASGAVLYVNDGTVASCDFNAVSALTTTERAIIQTTATAAELTSMAGSLTGATALVASGLGGSHAVLKSEAGTHTVLAAHATKARACLVIVKVDEVFGIGTGTLPTVEVGEDDTIDKCMAHTVLTNQAAGTTLVYAFTNLATKKVIVTTTAAIGNSTGGCTVTVLAIPTT
jgi:hypothetical protein